MGPETFRIARILIVDDEQAMVRLLELLLEQVGYTNLRSTTDPREVLECCAEFQPDLILLDLRLPHLDGVQVLKQLEGRRADLYLPVLVLTADVSRESRRAALEAGASDFVTKPFEQAELLLRVRNLLEMRFLHPDLRRQNATLEAQIRSARTSFSRRKSWRRWTTFLPASRTSSTALCRSSSGRSDCLRPRPPTTAPAHKSARSARPRSAACVSCGAS